MKLKHTAALLGLVLSTGCVDIAGIALDSQEMIPAASPAKRHTASVRVAIDGIVPNLSPRNHYTGMPRVTLEMVREAVTRGIEQSQLFSRVETGPDADYELRVIVNQATVPRGGGVLTSQTQLVWQLFDGRKAESPLWEKSISTTHDCTREQHRDPIARMRAATHEAMRENLRQGIDAISRLKLRHN